MGKVLYFFILKHLHVLVITFVGFRPDSAIGPELQSGVKCSKKNSCNYLELLLAKAAKRCIHLDLSLPKVAKSCDHLGLSLAKVAKSRNHLNLSPTKVAKLYLLFFQSSRFVASKSRFDAFCQKLSRLIASKSWEKQLQWSQFTASKSLKKVQSFRFIFSKARKNCNEFFQSTQFTASTRLLFWGQGGEKSTRFIASKIRKKCNFGK